jgi:hypothetical protein
MKPYDIRRVFCALISALIFLHSSGAAAVSHQDPDAAAIENVLIQQGIGPSKLDADLVAAWNELAYDIAFGEDQFLTFKGHRAFSMMHLAIHDALNSIVPVYQRYAYRGRRVPAHPIAAAAQAAYEVLASQYPADQLRLASELGTWLDPLPHGAAKVRGIELGKATAAAILKRRTGDGFDFEGTYEFQNEPGQYQTTPPWDGFVAQPGFRFAKPFALASQAQFRPPPPPQLESIEYARAFREVRAFGSVGSTVRTEDQTAYAIWWMEFAEGSINRLARQLVTRRGTNMWTAARMFAWINMALFDGYIADWDAKYAHNAWRPYTAIREADADNNPRTTPDAAWEPLRTTPPHPEYVSAHATGCAASLEILKRTFGDNVRFKMETITAPPGMPTRTFESFSGAASECADSRVRLGYHFRYATDAGLVLGRRVARYVVRNYLLRE